MDRTDASGTTAAPGIAATFGGPDPRYTVLLADAPGSRTVVAPRRPGYADYVARTGGFVPLPPKRPVT